MEFNNNITLLITANTANESKDSEAYWDFARSEINLYKIASKNLSTWNAKGEVITKYRFI